jgi:hypothetical protein
MDVKKVIDDLFGYIQQSNSEFVIPDYTVDTAVAELESDYTPLILKVLQKDETFFFRTTYVLWSQSQ